MKKLTIILYLALSFFSCKQNEEKKIDINANAAANLKIVQQFYAHFNAHNWAQMASLYANPADFKDPTLGLDMVKQTHAQTIKKYTEMGEAIKDVRDEVKATYAAGDKHIIVEFESTGTNPDGTKFRLPICTIFTIENGVITQDFTYFDNF